MKEFFKIQTVYFFASWGRFKFICNECIVQAPVVQKVDNAIHRINHYPLDIAIGFAITYPIDSDLSGG